MKKCRNSGWVGKIRNKIAEKIKKIPLASGVFDGQNFNLLIGSTVIPLSRLILGLQSQIFCGKINIRKLINISL
ncbi:hypothetical protein KJ885_01660 [Patescibacteria group bacterium]|nr:hypothetical protein [Patescibacteria group bacterium]